MLILFYTLDIHRFRIVIEIVWNKLKRRKLFLKIIDIKYFKNISLIVKIPELFTIIFAKK
jgi:hypothetical protein